MQIFLFFTIFENNVTYLNYLLIFIFVQCCFYLIFAIVSYYYSFFIMVISLKMFLLKIQIDENFIIFFFFISFSFSFCTNWKLISINNFFSLFPVYYRFVKKKKTNKKNRLARIEILSNVSFIIFHMYPIFVALFQTN